MKRCKICGTELRDDASFCYYCGEHCEESSNYKRANAAREAGRRRRKILRIEILLLLLILLGIASYFLFFISPANKAMTLIKQGNYESAKTIYDEQIYGNSLQNTLFGLLFKRELDTVLEDYSSGELSYERAKAELEGLKNIDIAGFSYEISEVSAQITEMGTNADLYSEGQEALKNRNYELAVRLFSQVPETDPYYEEAQKAYAQAVSSYKKAIFNDVGTPDSLDEYLAATETLKKAIALLPDDRELRDELNRYGQQYSSAVKAEVVPEARKAMEKEDYAKAIELLYDIHNYIDNDTELNALFDAAMEQFYAMLESDVPYYLDSNDYQAAMDLVDEAIKVLPEDQTVQDYYQLVWSNPPYWLDEFENGPSYKWKLAGAKEKNKTVDGTRISNDHLMTMTSGKYKVAYVQYYLGSRYNTLRGTVYVSSGSDEQGDAILAITDENGEEIYSSEILDHESQALNINVDVSGCDWITIRVSQFESTKTMKLLLSNFCVFER